MISSVHSSDRNVASYGESQTSAESSCSWRKVCYAIKEVAKRLIGRKTEDLFVNMGKTWDYMMADPQLRWCARVAFLMAFRFDFVAMLKWETLPISFSRNRRLGPEKGVIHIASGAVNNALWDLHAKTRKKPLWKLVVDMSPVSDGAKRSRTEYLR